MIYSENQEQFMVRNVAMKGYTGTEWNAVFTGSPGAPRAHCGKSGGGPYSTI